MNWLVIVIIAHVINALVFVITKVLLEKYITNATVFTVLVGIFGIGAFVLAPWGLMVPTTAEFLISVVTGALLILAMLLFNYVLKQFEASRIVPIVGGAVPGFTLLFAYLFLSERLSGMELWAFVLLVMGTVLISIAGEAKKRITLLGVSLGLLAGGTFAGSFVLTKYIFEIQPFISGFIWIRVGSFVVALALLLHGPTRLALKKNIKETTAAVKLAFVGQMLLGGIAFIMLNYAISIASVSLINALQGVQYAFLIVLVLVGAKLFPKLITERFEGWVLLQKIIAIVLISSGIALVAL